MISTLITKPCSLHDAKIANHAAWSSQRGFTLVEAIIVIVITGIVGAMVAVFIRLPVQGYVDSVARAQLTDVADTALRRMARDLRLALPNSVRISADGKFLELLLTKTGGRYLAEEDNPTSPTANVLDFMDSTKKSFDVVGAMPASPQNIVDGDYIVVYNLGPGQIPGDAYNCSGTCNRAKVSNTPVTNTVTLTSNPFALQSVKMKSPTRRFQVVTSPVTYYCDGSAGGAGTLTRYWNYAIQSAQPIAVATLTGAGATSAKLATKVVNCTFSYASLANTHSGLIGLTITLQDLNSSSAGTVVLSHQVHVDNTP